MSILLLASLVACTSDKDPGSRPLPEDSGAPGGEEHSEAPPPVDADGDGAVEGVDCDDADAGVFPGAAEICDGLDQDCDGEADEGVPGDGAGCQEPAEPDWDDLVSTLHVTLRTGSGENDGTNDYTELCLSETACFTLDNVDWDDLEAGATDVFVVEGLSLSRRAVDRVTLSISGGEDRYVPACLAVALDGEPVHCRDGLTALLGDDASAGEVLSWTDPEGLGASCLGCFEAPLTHGPMVGATGPGSTTIWLRTDASRRVALRLATSAEGLADASPAAVVRTEAQDDFTAEIPVFGLSAATTWHYDLEIEGARYGPWSFTTPREDGEAGPLRLAFGSCSRDDAQPVFQTILDAAPELFLFVGDNHYGDTSDLASNRQNYRWAHSRALREDLLAGTPTLATWDDHDYVGNNTGGDEPGRDIALRVFQEYWANASYGTEDTPGVFSAHTVGDVQIVLLDDRYHRGNDDSILGDAQESWLYETLLAEDATFRLLVDGSQWTTQGSDDSWAEHEEAQARLLQFLVDNAVGGVVLLSGDVHRSELRLLPGAAGGYDLPELTSSPLANSNAGCPDESEILACYDAGNSFVLVDIDTAAADPTLSASVVLEDGSVYASWTIPRSELGP